MIKFAQATKEDVLSIHPQLQQNEPEALSYGQEVFKKDMVLLEDRAVAVFDEDQCVGAYGVIEMWAGVARVWALFSAELVAKYPTLLALHIKKDLQRAEWFGFHRIEATTGAEHKMGITFLEWLGFEQEGLMRKYTPARTDMYLYAKVRDVI